MEYTKEFNEIWEGLLKKRLLQKKEELFGLYQTILEQPSRINALEIGTLQGATAEFLSKLYKKVYSIDNIKRYSEEKPFEFILGDTHKVETINKVHAVKKMFDLIFIDGDHTYEGVRMDFENYIQFAKKGAMIVFHDIIISGWHINQNCFVEKYWNEIKYNFRYKEFIYTGELKEKYLNGGWINEKHPSEWGGIGVLWYE